MGFNSGFKGLIVFDI